MSRRSFSPLGDRTRSAAALATLQVSQVHEITHRHVEVPVVRELTGNVVPTSGQRMFGNRDPTDEHHTFREPFLKLPRNCPEVVRHHVHGKTLRRRFGLLLPLALQAVPGVRQGVKALERNRFAAPVAFAELRRLLPQPADCFVDPI